ncbi:MAG: tRNA dihydrouridine synthase DusB [Candidatus Omnitrophica bacterium]|nr:tRNA dihydrouridine synthase DusB [Candidatus Omnitrophota bacterium]MDE2222621.1 tRNA dihydrouridine synthase DusB [Candidatus Omnitrophota bacterium]
MKIGAIAIDKPLCLAPMEDVTELPFRLICKSLGADIVYTEFTSSEGIIRDIPRIMEKIRIVEEERPVAIQIFGGRPEAMGGAAETIEKLKPDFIDINCGCWVKNHVARNEGAGLLRDLPLFEKVVKATVAGTKLPVTVKTRLGWDDQSIVILDVAKMVEASGAQALTLHCRTRSQAHSGFADWSWLEKIKKTIHIPVIGNGDITCPEDAKAMLETGCDGVMIGRGAIANPWIFKQTKHYLKTGEHLPEPSVEEKIRTCIEHLKLNVQYKGEKYGVQTFRKHYVGYLKGLPNTASVRSALMQHTALDQVIERLNQYLETSLLHEKI